MAFLRLGHALALILLPSTAVPSALAADQAPAAAPGLYDRPVLVIDPGMHMAPIKRASADAAGRSAVTGSDDKTVRVWSLADGALLRTIRLPTGPGDIGKAYAVAISPDGALIAVGGWTRMSEDDPQEQIYLFNRESGTLVRRVAGVRQVVVDLAFSANGHLLAATLGGGAGLRVYARERDWAEVARDEDYGDFSYGAGFAPDGRLATTALDSKVRLYSGDLEGDIRPVVTAAPVSAPYDVAFSPDGTRLAVGDFDSATVALLDGRTLASVPGPNLNGIFGTELSRVAWSRDGRTLFATGSSSLKVLAWSDAGAGTRRALPVRQHQDKVMGLVPLPGGDQEVASADPWLTRLQADGGTRWVHGPPKADFRAQHGTLSVSSDGTVVDFGFAFGGKESARFDLAVRAHAGPASRRPHGRATPGRSAG